MARPPHRSLCSPPAGRAWSTHLRAFDEDAMIRALQDGALEHVQLAPGRFFGDVAHSRAEPPTGSGTRLDWGCYNLPIFARGDLSRDRLTISVAIGGDGLWRGHGQPVRLGNIAIFPEGGELDVAMPAGAQWLTLQVPRVRLEAAGIRVEPRGGGSIGRVAGRLGPASWRALRELAPVLAPHGEADGARRPPSHDAVATAHAQLLDVLLCEIANRGGVAPRGHGDAQVGSAVTPAERWHLVRRVVAHLDARADPAVRIDELCVAAGTSVSRLERAFRDAFNVGPRRFLMLQRFAHARRALRRPAAATSVTEVATDWGFFHLGRFAQEYRTLYGERPSETLRRAAGGPR